MTRGRQVLAAVLAALALLVGGYLTQTGDEAPGTTTVERVDRSAEVDAESGLAWVRLDTLPAEVTRMVERIDRGEIDPNALRQVLLIAAGIVTIMLVERAVG